MRQVKTLQGPFEANGRKYYTDTNQTCENLILAYETTVGGFPSAVVLLKEEKGFWYRRGQRGPGRTRYEPLTPKLAAKYVIEMESRCEVVAQVVAELRDLFQQKELEKAKFEKDLDQWISEANKKFYAAMDEARQELQLRANELMPAQVLKRLRKEVDEIQALRKPGVRKFERDFSQRRVEIVRQLESNLRKILEK